jgi:hypothetical protein
MCQAFNCLPKPGGVLDQDWLLIEGMQYVLKAQADKQELDAARQRNK